MLPLEGVRVLAVEQYGAGPFGTQLLADQGAEVIKIENPRDGGDIGRRIGPHFFGPGDSLFFHSFNRNKRSLTLDLEQSAGLAVFRELCRSADAVASNLRGDVPERLGLTYAQLRDVNPRIVCAHLTAYGRSGPRASWPGYDYLMQAEAGWLMLTGEPGGAPARCGLSVVDMMSGLALAYGLLGALVSARASGQGRDVDVSLYDVALCNTTYLATWYLNRGVETERLPRSAHPSLTPCQLYRTRDGWIFLMCNKEKFWGELCRAIEEPQWIDDPRFKTFAERLAHRDLLTELLDAALGERTTEAWLERFAGRVPASPIRTLRDALESELASGEGRLQTLQHPEAGPYRVLAPPVRTSGDPPPARPAPSLGADTEALLRELGHDAASIRRLRAAGVV